MKPIPLTQGKTAWVDDDLFSVLSSFRWAAQKTPDGRYYAVRNSPLNEGGKRTSIGMHRQVALGCCPVPYYTDPKYKALRVFHEDDDGLNNTRQNLKVYVLSTAPAPVAVPPGVVLVSRKNRLPRELVAVERTERICFARGFGPDRYTGYVVMLIGGGYELGYKTFHDAAEAYVQRFVSCLSNEQKEADSIFLLYRAAVAAGTRLVDPPLPPCIRAEAPSESSALSIDDIISSPSGAEDIL